MAPGEPVPRVAADDYAGRARPRRDRRATDRRRLAVQSRDKVNPDIFRLRDESLEETANLPDPDVLAAEIVDDLETALEQSYVI